MGFLLDHKGGLFALAVAPAKARDSGKPGGGFEVPLGARWGLPGRRLFSARAIDAPRIT